MVRFQNFCFAELTQKKLSKKNLEQTVWLSTIHIGRARCWHLACNIECIYRQRIGSLFCLTHHSLFPGNSRPRTLKFVVLSILGSTLLMATTLLYSLICNFTKLCLPFNESLPPPPSPGVRQSEKLASKTNEKGEFCYIFYCFKLRNGNLFFNHFQNKSFISPAISKFRVARNKFVCPSWLHSVRTVSAPCHTCRESEFNLLAQLLDWL